MKEITISRELGDCSLVPKDNWKDLISSLVLAGYEVYADNEKLVFTLGCYDTAVEKNE